jgi:outer membrane protein assembly factor BamB
MPETRAFAARVALMLLLIAAGCTEREPPLRPDFEPLFEPVAGDGLMTISSPNLADLDGDGVPDIVFGLGVDRVVPEAGRYVFGSEPEIAGRVLAVSGATNETLWSVVHPGDAFTTPRFADLDGDGVPDVLMGGREGSFAALSGVDGTVLWRVSPADVAATPAPYNFTTPAVVGDVDDDGVPDMAVVYGGNALRQPGEPRDPSFLAVVSGRDGAVLAVHASPDGGEMYSSVVAYERADGVRWLIFGTGGETHPGAAFRARVTSLLDGTFPERVERLVAPGEKGVIAPPTLVDLTGDAELDIVLSTFDGRLVALDGASGATLWQTRDENEEAYHPPAVVRIASDGRLGLFVSRGIGAFPRYVGSTHRLVDAADGRVLYTYTEPNYPAGAPLAVDLTGDGVDEVLFFSVRFPSAQGARLHVLDARAYALVTHDLASNFWSTPLVADPRATGTLELIGVAWSQRPSTGDGAPTWRDLGWEMFRLDLDAPTPTFRSWAGYMGTAVDAVYHPPTANGGDAAVPGG